MKYIPSKGKDRDATDIAKALGERAVVKTYDFVQNTNTVSHGLPSTPRGRIIVAQTGIDVVILDDVFTSSTWSFSASVISPAVYSGIIGTVSVIFVL